MASTINGMGECNMISVIIPSYRSPECLDICLQSALDNQQNSNEIICVIDGFVEESSHVMEKYKDRVGFVPSEKNQGMQHSLNVGVWNATNEKILIVNDDNVFPKDWDVILESEDGKTIITPNQIERAPSIFNFETADFGGVEDFDLNKFTAFEPKYRKQELTDDGEIFPFYMSKTDYMMVGKTFKRSRKLNFYHFGSVATKNGKEGERFKASEQSAANIFKYKWGIDPIRHPNNSHKPTMKKFKGINYE